MPYLIHLKYFITLNDVTGGEQSPVHVMTGHMQCHTVTQPFCLKHAISLCITELTLI
jgi:hypothetical protein